MQLGCVCVLQLNCASVLQLHGACVLQLECVCTAAAACVYYSPNVRVCTASWNACACTAAEIPMRGQSIYLLGESDKRRRRNCNLL